MAFLTGEPENVGNKVVESKLQSIAHTCSAIDTYVVLNSLSSWH